MQSDPGALERLHLRRADRGRLSRGVRGGGFLRHPHSEARRRAVAHGGRASSSARSPSRRGRASRARVSSATRRWFTKGRSRKCSMTTTICSTRGVRHAVCDKTFQLFKKEPYREHFEFIEPLTPVPPEDAQPFDCERSAHPASARNQRARNTTPPPPRRNAAARTAAAAEPMNRFDTALAEHGTRAAPRRSRRFCSSTSASSATSPARIAT